MSVAATLSPAADVRADFPGMVTGDGAPWHYLDTAATAQKPQAVLDAMNNALGRDYATVHRGVYGRSAEMTLGYEAARRKVAEFMRAASDNEIVFVRGATEGINLVAHSWGSENLREGDRIMLSQLEHHSNIVPWQMVAERTGAAIDVCPLTEDGRIDLDALEAMLTPRHKMVALAHLSNVLGSVLDARRAARHAAKGGCASSRASSSGSLARAKRLEKPRLISVRKRWAQFEEGATPISRQRACTTQSAASSASAVRSRGSRRSKPIDQDCKHASGKA